MQNNSYNYGTLAPSEKTDATSKKNAGARHIAENRLLAGLVYGVFVTSTISKGRIREVDSKKATGVAGVQFIMSHINRSNMPDREYEKKDSGMPNTQQHGFRIFSDDIIRYYQQPVALVIADTYSAAVEAAGLVTVSYINDHRQNTTSNLYSAAVILQQNQDKSIVPESAFISAPVEIKNEYDGALEIEDPSAVHASIVVWDPYNEIADFNKVPSVRLAHKNIVHEFRLQEENVRIYSSFTGNDFDLSATLWPHETGALIGSRTISRPLVVLASRQQVLNMAGNAVGSRQQIKLMSAIDGAISRIVHKAITNETSPTPIADSRMSDHAGLIYSFDYIHKLGKPSNSHINKPSWAKIPASVSGPFALESAIDELACAINVDPLELRIKNLQSKIKSNIPWTGDHIKACYLLGAKTFGWQLRNPLPGSMMSGNCRRGMGMSAGVSSEAGQKDFVSISVNANGAVLIETWLTGKERINDADIKTTAAGIFTGNILSVQLICYAASLPEDNGQHNIFQNTANDAVYDAMNALQQKIKELAVSTRGTALSGKRVGELVIENGIISDNYTGEMLPVSELLKKEGITRHGENVELKNDSWQTLSPLKLFCAHFVEILIDPERGKIKINRIVIAVDAGKIINIKNAGQQVYKAALRELKNSFINGDNEVRGHETSYTNNSHNYRLGINAEIPPVEIVFSGRQSAVSGNKEIGEIELTGFSAAVANAVYHATGNRFRTLPVRSDQIA